MKETTRTIMGLPVMGNRSQSVFGIALPMHRDLFSRCSSVGFRNVTRQPICKALAKHYAAQLAMRDKMAAAMMAREFTRDQIADEWRRIVFLTTDTATSAFRDKFGPLPPCGFVPANKRADHALEHAANHALAEMSRLVFLRTSGAEYWNDASPMLGLPDTDNDVIYIFRQRSHSGERDGLKAQKIGRTSKIKQRNRAHKTSNTDLEQIAVIRKSSAITEAAVHRLLKERKMDGEREWFWLSPEESEMVCDPTRLAAEIRKAGLV